MAGSDGGQNSIVHTIRQLLWALQPVYELQSIFPHNMYGHVFLDSIRDFTKIQGGSPRLKGPLGHQAALLQPLGPEDLQF